MTFFSRSFFHFLICFFYDIYLYSLFFFLSQSLLSCLHSFFLLPFFFITFFFYFFSWISHKTQCHVNASYATFVWRAFAHPIVKTTYEGQASGDRLKAMDSNQQSFTVFCENLGFSAKICGCLRFPAPSACLNFQERDRVNLRKSFHQFFCFVLLSPLSLSISLRSPFFHLFSFFPSPPPCPLCQVFLTLHLHVLHPTHHAKTSGRCLGNPFAADVFSIFVPILHPLHLGGTTYTPNLGVWVDRIVLQHRLEKKGQGQWKIATTPRRETLKCTMDKNI